MTFVMLVVLGFLMICVLDSVVFVRASKKKNEIGHYISRTMLFSLLLTGSYMISLFVTNELVYSVLSSLYFIGVDLTLYSLMRYVLAFVMDGSKKPRHSEQVLGWLSLGYLIFDIAMLMLNPFTGIVIRYVPRDTVVSHFSYDMGVLFILHLTYAYILVAASLYQLVRKAMHVPNTYRAPYLQAVAVILAVVAFNALYLYIPGPEGYDFLDWSLAGYSAAGFFLYFLSFENTGSRYSELQSWIYENVNQGIVLFDYNNRLVMHNHIAEKLLPEKTLQENMYLEEFAERCGLQSADMMSNERRSVQCCLDEAHVLRSVQCDINVMLSAKGDVLSRLFVFSNLSTEVDVLTGFYNWSYFKQSSMAHVDEPYVVMVSDINGLSVINLNNGHEIGDLVIQHLADTMRRCFPSDTCFVRGQEANLIAVCMGMSVEKAHACMDEVSQQLVCVNDIQISTQSVVCESKGCTNVPDIIRDGVRTLRTKKLLDKNSNHSDNLNSLIQALKECDKDTEMHVQRTQKLGMDLARRLKLNDTDMNNLALLAMLHDIGKIGIPLEILNKPGKLTDSEWTLLKTHAEKGYQICASSPELRGIAEMVLHHHERWDGHGYPMGLSKESIPLLSRVISVVDAYDAMTNDRAYHKKMTTEMAKAELIRNAGTQFDPNIVSAFLEVLEGMLPVPADEAVKAQEGTEEDQEEERRWSASVVDSFIKIQNVHVVDYCEYLMENDSRITTVNDKFEELTGYTREDVKQLSLKHVDLLPEEDRDGYMHKLAEILAHKDTAYLEHRLRRKDGQVIYVYCLGTNYYDSSVSKMRTRVVVTNVADSYAFQTMTRLEDDLAATRMRRWEDKYRRDPLTGLLTREAFKNDVQEELLSGKHRAMMLMVDVDHFKSYNDKHGHLAGDEYLTLVARYMSRAIRDQDLAARMGGDEFAAVVFFNSDVDENVMTERAQRIFDTINMYLSTHSEKEASVSIGAAFTGNGVQTFDQLYESADRALYRAKNNGRSRISM